MTAVKLMLSTFAILLTACAATDKGLSSMNLPAVPTPDDARAVSPALAHTTDVLLLGEVWKRPGLSPRDRSLVTVAVLISRGQTVEMAYHFNRALDNGVTPLELSETINHLAYYSGWGNATATLLIAKDVFAARNIGADQLAPVSPTRLPLDEANEQARVAQVDKNVGPVAPGLVEYTTRALFRDLWLRPGLAPRERSLITVSSLVANGQVAQVTFHLNRAMDNGLKQSEASEMLTQLAFYAGWPNTFSAVPVFKDVFSKRQEG
ncbi:carboxymuconolactone decarboxylase family protein [Pseudomonas viridiflava]|uniref:carboxymuconolactone decarboxylase family protein n=1 Tax=Pseudomonas viridiflava TaxID=33069 RepID=UPI002B1D8154|nr:carboxymuconolactone decarboxylase family protein [Pseudomonas viridiflava]